MPPEGRPHTRDGEMVSRHLGERMGGRKRQVDKSGVKGEAGGKGKRGRGGGGEGEEIGKGGGEGGGREGGE